MSHHAAWGADFDPDELARLETRMWKAYYRRQPARLFLLLIEALHAQARVSWPRTLGGQPAAHEGRRRLRPIERRLRAVRAGHRPRVPAARPARARRCRGRRPARAALVGRATRARPGVWSRPRATRSRTCTRAIYDVPRERVAEAGRLRGLAAEVRDRGATRRSGRAARLGTGLLAGGRPPAARLVSEPARRPGRSPLGRHGHIPGSQASLIRASPTARSLGGWRRSPPHEVIDATGRRARRCGSLDDGGVRPPPHQPLRRSPPRVRRPEEAHLLANVRLDLQSTCAPARDGLPEGAIAAIECRPASDVVGRVGLILFGTQDDLMRTYLATLAEREVQPRTNGGRCLPDEPSEGAYTPGDDGPDLSATRSGLLRPRGWRRPVPRDAAALRPDRTGRHRR